MELPRVTEAGNSVVPSMPRLQAKDAFGTQTSQALHLTSKPGFAFSLQPLTFLPVPMFTCTWLVATHGHKPPNTLFLMGIHIYLMSKCSHDAHFKDEKT